MPIRCARSMSSSSPISTACSGFTCACSIPSTCSNDSSRARARDQIQAEIRRLEDRIRRLEKEPESANRSRIRQSLEANLETCHSRLSNLAKARENHELLQAEIENLETKIQSITELAINRSDAEAITGQVEQITQGLIRTEQTINDLGFATGVESFDLTVPTILAREVDGPAEASAPEPPPPRRQRENEIRYPVMSGSGRGRRMALARGRLILGINCAYHESAAALVRDGEVVFAIEEERLTRIKHAKIASRSQPRRAALECHSTFAFVRRRTSNSRDLDAIAYSLAPGRRLALIGGDPYEIDDKTGFGSRAGEEEFNRRVLGIPSALARAAGDHSLTARFHFVPHHRAHAASAFYASPFQHAAVLVVDGIGETSTAWLGRGSPQGLDAIEEVPYPHSIGMLWERVAVYLGFTEFDACKVMGLAAYRRPRTLPRRV